MIEAIVVNCGLTWFIYAFINKIGLLEWLQLRSPNNYYTTLLNCEFCLSFRFAFISLIPYLIFIEFDFVYLFVPLITSGITSKLSL